MLRVFLRARGNLGHDVCYGFVCLSVDIAHHCGPEGVEYVAASAEQEDVEEELSVV